MENPKGFINIQAPQWALSINWMSAFVNKKQGALQIFFIFPQTAVEMIQFKKHIEQSRFPPQYNISFGCCRFTSSVTSALMCVCRAVIVWMPWDCHSTWQALCFPLSSNQSLNRVQAIC